MAKDKKAKKARKPIRLELDRMVSICFMNQKGGVAKTTTTVTTAVALAEMGYRVLVVDLDPQANATSLLNVEVGERPAVFELIKAECSVKDAIVASTRPPVYRTDEEGYPIEEDGEPVVKRPAAPRGIDVIPADASLQDLASEAVSMKGVDSRLVKPLEEVSRDYDFCLIDCPPSLGFETVIALTASDYLVVPTKADLFSIEGFARLFDTVDEVVRFTNDKLKVLGILFTCTRKNTKIFKRTYANASELARQLGTFVYKSSVRFTVKVDDGCDDGLTIVEYAPSSGAAQDYREFASELVEAVRKEVE